MFPTSHLKITNAHTKREAAIMYEAEQFPTMSEREKYLFDLQGFIVVKGLLSTDEIKCT